jgi:hypothetical protein
MTKFVACVLAAIVALSYAPPLRASERVSPNDTARFLAGLHPSPDSPLSALTKSAVWQRHAARFDTLFELKNRDSLNKIRVSQRGRSRTRIVRCCIFLAARTFCTRTRSLETRRYTF